METVLYPTAGYIPDLSQNTDPGRISISEREYLRTLACKVYEIANSSKQEEKRKLWYQHNRLEKIRQMVLIFPEDSWIEIIGEDELKAENPYWRQWEWYLKHLIYRDENLHDDFVIEPDLYVTPIIHMSSWGLEPKYIHPESQKGAVKWEPPIKNLDDIKKLRYPTLEIDEKATQKRFESVSKIFGDLLPVQIYYPRWTSANLIGEATTLRGIEQVMWDMHDNRAWLHDLMEFITEGNLRILKYLEENGYLSLNNRGHYTDSGGIGYNNELPAHGFNGRNVRLCDLWGFGVAQELSEVGPDQHEEFILRYQVRILERFGLNAYGCCEPYTNKFDMLKKRIPRLRRSVESLRARHAGAGAAGGRHLRRHERLYFRA